MYLQLSKQTQLLACGITLLVATNLVVGCNQADEKLVRIPDVVYSSPNGSNLHLDFVRPAGDGPYPLVVCIHGGGWRVGTRTEYKSFQTSMAKHGIATAAVQYRFAPDALYPAQIDDVRNAVKFVLADQERFRIDQKRIIWTGGSAGGHLALLAGLENTDDYTTRLIINVAGPSNLRTFQSLPSGDDALKRHVTRDSSELLSDLLGTSDRNADVYREASPIELVRAGSPRVVTFHGAKDDIVPLSQSEALHAKLKELGVPELLVVAQSGGHNIGAWDAKELHSAMLEMVKEIQSAIAPEQ